MRYPITEKLLKNNRPGKPLKPMGLVIHATDDPGATAQSEASYFNSGYRGASVHYFADWTVIIRTIPENEMAWHAGPTANHRFLSVEMCEPAGHDPEKFQEVWNRTVWLAAGACVRYGWTGKDIWSHKMVSDTWHETDHTDPIGYLARYGQTWEGLLAGIDAQTRNIKTLVVEGVNGRDHDPGENLRAWSVPDVLRKVGSLLKKA